MVYHRRGVSLSLHVCQVDLVHHLLEHVKHSEGTYRDEIIAKVRGPI